MAPGVIHSGPRAILSADHETKRSEGPGLTDESYHRALFDPEFLGKWCARVILVVHADQEARLET